MAAELRPLIFISYRRTDSEFAYQLRADLEASGFSTWIDAKLSDEGGQEWLKLIQEAVDECQALIVIMSPDSVESKYVHMEYHRAQAQKKLVVPVYLKTVDKAPMDLELDQWIEFRDDQGKSDWYQAGLANLLGSLSKAPSPPKLPDFPVAPVPTPLTISEGDFIPEYHAVSLPPPPPQEFKNLVGAVYDARGRIDLVREQYFLQEMTAQNKVLTEQYFPGRLARVTEQIAIQRVGALRDLAHEAVRGAEWRRALGAWQALLEQAPRDREALAGVAEARREHAEEALRDGDFDESVGAWQELLKSGTNATAESGLQNALLARFNDAYDKGQWTRALESLETLRLRPKQPEELGELVDVVQQNVRAEVLYTSAIGLLQVGNKNAAQEALRDVYTQAPYYGDSAHIAAQLGFKSLPDLGTWDTLRREEKQRAEQAQREAEERFALARKEAEKRDEQARREAEMRSELTRRENFERAKAAQREAEAAQEAQRQADEQAQITTLRNQINTIRAQAKAGVQKIAEHVQQATMLAEQLQAPYSTRAATSTKAGSQAEETARVAYSTMDSAASLIKVETLLSLKLAHTQAKSAQETIQRAVKTAEQAKGEIEELVRLQGVRKTLRTPQGFRHHVLNASAFAVWFCYGQFLITVTCLCALASRSQTITVGVGFAALMLGYLFIYRRAAGIYLVAMTAIVSLVILLVIPATMPLFDWSSVGTAGQRLVEIPAAIGFVVGIVAGIVEVAANDVPEVELWGVVLLAAIFFLYLPTAIIVAAIVGPIALVTFKISYGTSMIWLAALGVGLLVGWAAIGTLYIMWFNWRRLPEPEKVVTRSQKKAA